MVTLRFDFHMGRVECVTCHVPESQEVVGDANEGCGRSVVFGGRRVIGFTMAGNIERCALDLEQTNQFDGQVR